MGISNKNDSDSWVGSKTTTEENGHLVEVTVKQKRLTNYKKSAIGVLLVTVAELVMAFGLIFGIMLWSYSKKAGLITFCVCAFMSVVSGLLGFMFIRSNIKVLKVKKVYK